MSEITSVPKLRADIEKAAGFFGKLPKGFRLEPVKIGHLSCEWMLPAEAEKDRAILYFHGGGLVAGSVRSHRGIVAKFVNRTGIGAFVFDYALAPEHPFPEGLDDSVAAYRYLLEQGVEPSGIVFIGDSGGGNLLLATLLALQEKEMPQPAGAVTLSAWTDLRNTSESITANADKDTLCWKDAQVVFSKYYAGENDPGLPLISPVYGDLAGLPPLLLFAGGDELLRDDSVRFAAKAKQAGVDVTLRIGEGLFHCYPACSPLFPEAEEAMEEIVAFVRSRIHT